VTRSGFVAVAGRPNVGKSTLVNAIVGDKVAIVSEKPQTTRRAIRGVLTTRERQLVLVDLPGVQRPRDALTRRMQRRVEQELADADGALLVLNAEQGVGPGDRFIASLLGRVDRCSSGQVLEVLADAARLGVGEDLFPLSARKGTGVGAMVEHLSASLPEGPFLFPTGERSDQPAAVALAELVREQVLRRTRQEVPHAVEVEVDEVAERRSGLVGVHASVWVETESQKGILIGSGGRMIKAIGIAARREIEGRLGRRVHLELDVRVRRGWRADDRLLDRLGIE